MCQNGGCSNCDSLNGGCQHKGCQNCGMSCDEIGYKGLLSLCTCLCVFCLSVAALANKVYQRNSAATQHNLTAKYVETGWITFEPRYAETRSRGIIIGCPVLAAASCGYPANHFCYTTSLQIIC